MNTLAKLSADPRFSALPLDPGKLRAYLAECEKRGVRYDLGAKAPSGHLADFPPDYSRIDCSGFVRAMLAYASAGEIVIPDGSVNQRNWFAARNFKPAAFSNCSELDGRLRICFLAPSDTPERIGHVWLCLNARTLESYGAHGPGSRAWNSGLLAKCHAAFVAG